MIYDLWNVYQQGQISSATEAAQAAKRDAKQTDARLHSEVLRLESKIDGLALVCQALFELLRDKGGVSQQEVEARMREIDLRDGSEDGRIRGGPAECPRCHRRTHTRQRVCMYCGAPIAGGLLVEKASARRATRPRTKSPRAR